MDSMNSLEESSLVQSENSNLVQKMETYTTIHKREPKNKLDVEPFDAYGWEVWHVLHWFADKFNTVMTTLMPEVLNDFKKNMEQSNSWTDFMNNGLGKKNIFYQILWIILDLSWKLDFKEAKKKWWVFDVALWNSLSDTLKLESINCLKDFADRDHELKDEMQITVKDTDALQSVPVFRTSEDVNTVANKLVHLDNMYAVIEKRYESKYVRFSPYWLESYAEKKSISPETTDEVIVFNKEYNAWEVSSTATSEQKKALFKGFITDKVEHLWTDVCDKKIKESINTWSHLTAYLFGEYISWRYEYHQVFQKKDEKNVLEI
jgi:hypothetical protein